MKIYLKKPVSFSSEYLSIISCSFFLYVFSLSIYIYDNEICSNLLENFPYNNPLAMMPVTLSSPSLVPRKPISAISCRITARLSIESDSAV